MSVLFIALQWPVGSAVTPGSAAAGKLSSAQKGGLVGRLAGKDPSSKSQVAKPLPKMCDLLQVASCGRREATWAAGAGEKKVFSWSQHKKPNCTSTQPKLRKDD